LPSLRGSESDEPVFARPRDLPPLPQRHDGRAEETEPRPFSRSIEYHWRNVRELASGGRRAAHAMSRFSNRFLAPDG
jgi:hypothetical protein